MRTHPTLKMRIPSFMPMAMFRRQLVNVSHAQKADDSATSNKKQLRSVGHRSACHCSGIHLIFSKAALTEAQSAPQGCSKNGRPRLIMMKSLLVGG